MDPTFWAALAGAGTAGLFTALGVWLTTRHAARERAADRHHEIKLERDRAVSRQDDARREPALPAMQRFSAVAELLIRQLELSAHTDGDARSPNGNVDGIQADLEDALLGLELLASDEALRAAQDLVRMIRPQDPSFSDGDRADEWRALGLYREVCRRDLFG